MPDTWLGAPQTSRKSANLTSCSERQAWKVGIMSQIIEFVKVKNANWIWDFVSPVNTVMHM